MRYQRLIRPAVEARSLVIPITFGCSWARCQFCSVHVHNHQFRIRDLEEIKRDLDEVARQVALGDYERVFLADGDALVVRHERLVAVLSSIREKLPQIQRVGIYGNAHDILRRTPQQLRELKERGLGIIYQGLESGDPEVLRRVDKGSTPEMQLEAGRRVLEAGLLLSVTIVLGLGGTELSKQHAFNTARILTLINPSSVRVHSLVITPALPMARWVEEGTFQPPDAWGILAELRLLIEHTDLWDTPLLANMPSNYLPLVGLLANDRQRLLAEIDKVLASRDSSRLRPEAMRVV